MYVFNGGGGGGGGGGWREERQRARERERRAYLASLPQRIQGGYSNPPGTDATSGAEDGSKNSIRERQSPFSDYLTAALTSHFCCIIKLFEQKQKRKDIKYILEYLLFKPLLSEE